MQSAENELERLAADLLGKAAWTAALRARAKRAESTRVAYRDHVANIRASEFTIPPIELLDTLAPV